MKAYLLPVLLQVIGFLVIIAEIFIPSMGLLTLIAIAVYGYSIYIVFSSISSTAGLVFTGLDIILVPVFIVIGMNVLARSSLSLRRELSSREGVQSQNQTLKDFLKMTGTSVTDLRPAGIALISSQRVDVVTDGDYIEKDTPIIVTGISGNRVVVEKVE